MELKSLSGDTGQKGSIHFITRSGNLSNQERFECWNREVLQRAPRGMQGQTQMRGLAPKLWLPLLPEFWMNRLYFNLSRSRTANKQQQEMHKPSHFDTVPLCITEFHVLLSRAAKRAGGSLHGIFLNNNLTFFTRFS